MQEAAEGMRWGSTWINRAEGRVDRVVTGELGLRRTGDQRFVCISFPWQYLLPCCDAAGSILILGSRLLWSQVAQQGAGRQRALLQRGGRGCSPAVPIALWISAGLGAMCTLAVIKPLPGSPNSSVPPRCVLQPCPRERGLAKDGR